LDTLQVTPLRKNVQLGDFIVLNEATLISTAAPALARIGEASLQSLIADTEKRPSDTITSTN
jgi:hypothetical protein